jgi:Zn-dependent protease
MQNGTFTVGRIGGTEIRLHWTLLFIIPYVMTTFKPENLSSTLRAFLLVGLIFACVLLHELGHTLVARLHGIQVPSVILYPLGGAAMTEREADHPLGELLIAAAGPLVNFLLAGVMILGLAVTGLLSAVFAPSALRSDNAVLNSLIFLIASNLILAVSNLAPIYPLDGGRIFRALAQMLFGPVRANLVTFWISLVFALVVLIASVFTQSWLLVLTALFLVIGACSLNQRLVIWSVRLYARITRRPDLYVRILDFDPAILLLTQAIDATPQNLSLYLQRAFIYYFMDDYLRALADSSKVLAVYPDNLQALMLRGALFYAQNYLPGTWECIERCDQVRPNWSAVWLNRAILHRDEGNLTAAMSDIEQAIQTSALEKDRLGTTILYLTRSSIDYKLGDYTAMVADWETAYVASPREATTLTTDRVRIFAKDWNWARDYFSWLEGRSAHSPLIPLIRGEVALRSGQYAQAVEDLTQAMSRYEAHNDLYYFRAQAYQGLGQYDLAIADYRHAASSPRAHIRRMATKQLKAVGGI